MGTPESTLTDVLRAAEALADAAEDVLHAEGDHRPALEAAWQAYVDLVDRCPDPVLRDAQKALWAERDDT